MTGFASSNSGVSPSMFRRRPSAASTSADSVKKRPQRSNTVRTYHPPSRPNWEPGAEPGIDTTKEFDDDGEHKPLAPCDIAAIDFSEDRIEEHSLDNASLKAFMLQPRPDWCSCRWICVDGLSWDVIKLLGNCKGLHRLAIEDLMNTRSRPKADWYVRSPSQWGRMILINGNFPCRYSDQCFIVLTLQKLVRLNEKSNESAEPDTEEASSFEEEDESFHKPNQEHWLKRWIRGSRIPQRASTVRHVNFEDSTEKAIELDDIRTAHSSTSELDPIESIRTLQRYRALQNTERVEYMESRSALTSRNLAVSVEQVSIFLTDDNTVISFFEHSASDILKPLRSRLHSSETILRRSSDASMLTQALIDAIVDLAMPVAAAYDDAIGELELEVLTDPDISQPKALYILTSEITLLRNFIEPIASLVHALRDHRSEPLTTPAITGRPHPMKSAFAASSVSMTPLAHTYLGDVEDHVITLSSALDRMRNSAENLTSLIFNTVSAYQNESIKQLTLVTIFFLVRTRLLSMSYKLPHRMRYSTPLLCNIPINPPSCTRTRHPQLRLPDPPSLPPPPTLPSQPLPDPPPKHHTPNP